MIGALVRNRMTWPQAGRWVSGGPGGYMYVDTIVRGSRGLVLWSWVSGTDCSVRWLAFLLNLWP